MDFDRQEKGYANYCDQKENVYKKNFSFIYTCHRRVGGWLLKRRLNGSLYKAAPSRRQRDLSGIDLGL